MCKLCSIDETELQAARKDLNDFADKLEQMVLYVRDVVEDKIHPHDTSLSAIPPLANEIRNKLTRLGL